MPIAKNPILRFRIINACLSSKHKRYWTALELIEKLRSYDYDVKKRTLERDLALMRYDERLGYYAPIAYDPKKRAYYYTDFNFSIQSLLLSPEDLETLGNTSAMLQKFKGLGFVNAFQEIVDKLTRLIEHMRIPQRNDIIAFEDNGYNKGRDHFDDILRLISGCTVASIRYQKFNRQETDEHIFHPYFLKEYRQRWYVLGYSETRRNTITLALDRIVSVTDTTLPFQENKELNPEKYFQHTLGVTTGQGPLEDIHLHFSPVMAPYIKTQYLHSTQHILSEDETGLTISLQLIVNPELMQELLRYCPHVTILKPASLKEKYILLLQEGIKNGK